MKLAMLAVFVFVTSFAVGQIKKDFLLVKEDTSHSHKFNYVFLNNSGDTVLRLDSTRYYMCFSDTVYCFAIVGIKGKSGWWAIDKTEKLLFKVYNTSSGEPLPDEINEGMIRIVDNNGRIGFANEKGEIAIKPQFEAATKFYKGKAIVGFNCNQVQLILKNGNKEKHFTAQCSKGGYVDKQGKVTYLGNYTFEQIKKQLKCNDNPLN